MTKLRAAVFGAVLAALVLVCSPGRSLPELEAQIQVPPAAAPVVITPASGMTGGGVVTAPQALFQDGTAPAPSIAWASNPATGFYKMSGQQAVGVAAGGAPALGVYGSFLLVPAASSIGFVSTADPNTGTADTLFTRRAAGEFGWSAVLFAALGTPANGTFCYCSDCTVAAVCVGAGTGALAKRLNGVWVCN